MNALRVDHPGMHSSVQDQGRIGYRHLGVPISGAFDAEAHRIGNALLGNRCDDASIEMTMVGAQFTALCDVRICLTGAEAEAVVRRTDGRTSVLSTYQVESLSAGTVIRIGRHHHGIRSYLCVAGGIQTKPLLGSRSALSSFPDAGLGVVLRPGDILPLRINRKEGETSDLRGGLIREFGGPLRIVRGTHWDLFSESQRASLAASVLTVSDQSNRVGIRLIESPLRGAYPERVESTGTLPGHIQIPPSGEPILLGVDGPTSGGYPLIACVIEADLPRVAQLAPRSQVRFEWITLETAWRINAEYAALERRTSG